MHKILVIEDEPFFRQSLLKFLTNEGFYAIGAENGSIGVKLARTHGPDLILCDLMMPEMDGYEVLTRLQQDPATAMIPFICLTAKDERADLRHVMELGGDDYLTKPFSTEELLGAIFAQLNKRERTKQHQTSVFYEAIAQLNNRVYYDSLTNLPNRLLLRDRFEQISQGIDDVIKLVPVAVLAVDQLDRFKDSLGTDYCDLLLEVVLERSIPYVRERGIAVRLNNERLALILPPIREQQEAIRIARTILQAISHPIFLVGYKISISGSMGMALYPKDGKDFDSLLKNANTATHQARQLGGDRCEPYAEAIQVKSRNRLMLEIDLRQAIEREEFQVYYQPQVDLQTGKIVGAEALVRWQHPERGLMLPTEFISLAEETGLVLALDEWMLQTVCRQAKAWNSVGLILSVAVNLSGRQFDRPDIGRRVMEILQVTGLDPRWLELELTESVLVQHPHKAIATLAQLKDSGIQLCLDDFGTGYSSLSYLQKFPLDTLKIDRSFVQNATVNSKNAAIIVSIVQMAHSLQLKVVAEGIETEAQQAFCRQHRCDVMQGYWFSRPVLPEVLEKMLWRDRSRQVGLAKSI